MVQNYSEAQVIVLHRALLRAGEAVPPPGPEFIEWLTKAQLVIPAGVHVGQLQQIDPLRMSLKDQNFRTYVLGYMTGFDCFTESMAVALEVLLGHTENHPNLVIDPRRLRRSLRDINSAHRQAVHNVWSLVDRAYQRFNENVGLGRPLHIGLDILFDELKEYRVFSGGPRAHEELHNIYERIDELVAKIKAGKAHPDNLLRSTINQLENLTTNAFSNISNYWYSEIMIKHYFRDTLIPNAILNHYIDPQKTSDLLGAVWRFITDLSYDPHLLICRPLLRHQPQASGARYATVADFIEEINFSKVRSNDFPSLKVRIEQKESQIADPTDTNPSLTLLCEHPSIRLSHEQEYILYLLSEYASGNSLQSTKLKGWLSNSLFSIDPRHGIPAQSLSTALRLGLIKMRSGASIEDIDITDLQAIYLRVLQNKCANIQQALKFPFNSEYVQELKRLDPFELRESLVDIILEGIYQPASDWQEEQIVATAVTNTIRAIDIAEKEESLDKIENLQNLFNKISKGVYDLQERAEKIVFDRPSLRLWQTLCIDIFLILNQSHKRGIFNLPYDQDLMVPVNYRSMHELFNDNVHEQLILALREIANS
jgi:hypothetical protein